MRAAKVTQEDDEKETIKIAASLPSIRTALGLVYRAYRKDGLTAPSASQIRITPYHLLATTEVLLGIDEFRPACTVSMVHDGELGLPMESTFPAEIAKLRKAGYRCVEGSCLAYRDGGSESSFAMVAKLMSFAIQCAARRGCDYILLAVHPRHAPFYCRFYGAEYLADNEQPHAAVHGNPAVALKFDLMRLPPPGSRSYKRIYATHYSAAELAYRPAQPSALTELARLYVEANPREVARFSAVWPHLGVAYPGGRKNRVAS